MTEPHNQPPGDDELREMFERFQGLDSPSPLPRRSRRKRLGLSLAFVVLLLAGAAVVSIVIDGDHHGPPQKTIFSPAAPMCLPRVDFEGRQYVGDSEDSPRRGDLLGTGIIPGCSHVTPVFSSDGTITRAYTNTAAAQSVNVYGVVGADPSDVVMIEHDMSTDMNTVEDDMNTVYFSESILKRLADTACLGARDYQADLDCLKSKSSP